MAKRWPAVGGRRRIDLKGLLHLEDEPHKIAGGLAVGAFISFSPLYGLHMVMALALAFLLRVNKAATLVGTWVVLPWFAPFTLGLGYFLGRFLLGGGIGLPEMGPLGADWIWRNFLPLLLGCSLEGGGAAVLTYFLAKRAVIGWRRKQRGTSLSPAGGAGEAGGERGSAKEGQLASPGEAL